MVVLGEVAVGLIIALMIALSFSDLNLGLFCM